MLRLRLPASARQVRLSALAGHTLLFVAIAVVHSQSAQPSIDAGVPLTLAQERARRLSDVRYDLHFSVPSSVAEAVRGRLRLRFALGDAAGPVVLDFAEGHERIVRAAINGRTARLDGRDEHLIVPAAALRRGENDVAIEFLAGDASLNRNPEFMYTLFVPARARLAFPCFDQPDIKARYTLSLEVPKGWEALGNGAELSRETDGDRLRLRFAETPPLPTYLFAFGAGQFAVETADRGGRRLRMFHRETDAEKVARNRDAIFDLHAAALDWLERYTDIRYPWGKFDFLLVPSFQFGGMEHAGAVSYNASALLLDPSATQNQKLGRASLIAHETAHMWFGDLVTMRWFDDVWMKEVFANFMAAKIVNPSFPEVNHDLRFLFSHYPTAYEVDRTRGTNAIRQRLDNLNEAGSLYGAIIYQKAPIVMRQLEMMLGEESLRDGLRDYLKSHAFANASWPDLIALLDRRTPENLDAWSRAWVEEAGRPTITTELQAEGNAVKSLALVQTDPIQARGLVWSQQLKVAIGYGRDIVGADVRLNGPRAEIAAAGPAIPLYVLPTAQGIGYGNFVLDSRSRAYFLANLPAVEDPLQRGSILVTLWEEMLDGRVRPRDMLDVLVRGLPGERDELNLQRMLAYTQRAYWRWIPAAERNARAGDLETLLRAGLDKADSASTKSAWFNALRDMAHTPATLQFLERVWSKSETVPGLVLAEPDFITLAQALALRAVPEWKAILDTQYGRIENPDRKARFAFVRPALSADQAVRDALFDSLQKVENRRREPWVLEAVGYLHHPLRARSSEKYVLPSLALVSEIQRTGDIFFPKRWMDATLAGHGSASAAHTVTDFLRSLPRDYPERLRRIVLSSADDLFRTNR
jgi:aminopeptidase N